MHWHSIQVSTWPIMYHNSDLPLHTHYNLWWVLVIGSSWTQFNFLVGSSWTQFNFGRYCVEHNSNLQILSWTQLQECMYWACILHVMYWTKKIFQYNLISWFQLHIIISKSVTYCDNCLHLQGITWDYITSHTKGMYLAFYSW
jgi:hypothetical protein